MSGSVSKQGHIMIHNVFCLGTMFSEHVIPFWLLIWVPGNRNRWWLGKKNNQPKIFCFVPAKKGLKVWPQIFLGWLIGISLHLSMNYPNFMIFWVQAPCFLNFLLVKSQIVIIFVASIPVTLWSSWLRDPFLRRKKHARVPEWHPASWSLQRSRKIEGKSRPAGDDLGEITISIGWLGDGSMIYEMNIQPAISETS